MTLNSEYRWKFRLVLHRIDYIETFISNITILTFEFFNKFLIGDLVVNPSLQRLLNSTVTYIFTTKSYSLTIVGKKVVRLEVNGEMHSRWKRAACCSRAAVWPRLVFILTNKYNSFRAVPKFGCVFVNCHFGEFV